MSFLRPSAAKQTTVSTGTGTLTLIPNAGDTRSFQQALGAGPVSCRVMLRGNGYFEMFRGTYTAPSTLTRDEVIISSNSDNLVAIPPATSDVYLLDYAQFLLDRFTANKTLTNKDSSNTWFFSGTTLATLTMPAISATLPDFWGLIRNMGSAPLIPTAAGSDIFDETAQGFVALLPGESAYVNLDTTTGVWRVCRMGAPTSVAENVLLNPRFLINQRALSTVANGAYCLDRFYALTQTGAVAPTQVADPENGFEVAAQLTQSQASAQRIGLASVIEGKDCKFMRGGYGTLWGRVKCSASINIRYAILGWTGTEDQVTRDVVNSWTSGTYTTGNFFKSSNMQVLGVGSLAVTGGAYAALPPLAASLGTTFNNLFVFVWTESAVAQNVTLALDFIKLRAGSAPGGYDKVAKAAELSRCGRYCHVWTAPAAFSIISQAWQGTDGISRSFLKFHEPMRTGAFTFSAVGNFGFFNDVDGSNQGSVTVSAVPIFGGGASVNLHGTGISMNTAGGPTAGIGWHVAYNSIGARLICDDEI